MKTTLLALTIGLISLSAHGQSNGVPTFMDKIKQSLDPSSITELYTYEADDILNVLKINRASRKNEVFRVIDHYNSEVKALRTDNLSAVAGLGMSLKDIFSNKEFGDIFTTRADYKENMSKIKAEKQILHAEMETELKEVLTRRQERKWNNYKMDRRQQIEEQFELADLLEYIGF